MISICEGECKCGREIQTLIPWHNGLGNSGSYIKCNECERIAHVEMVGKLDTDKQMIDRELV